MTMRQTNYLQFEELKAGRFPDQIVARKDYGTFNKSLRAPSHRWFQYPAGFSFRFLEEKIRQYRTWKQALDSRPVCRKRHNFGRGKKEGGELDGKGISLTDSELFTRR